MFLLIILGVGFAALNTGNNLLYLVLSLLLAFLTLSGILSESALRGIEIRRSLPREIFAGIDNPVQFEIKNTQTRVPSFAIVIEDRAASEKPGEDAQDWRLRSDEELPVLGRVFALRVGPGETVPRSYALHPEQRGPLHFHSVRVSTRFPFGLFSKSRTIWAGDSALVYPEIAALRNSPIDPSDDETGEGRNSAKRLGNTADGLREFEIGDSLRRVHWKSSLRRNQLHVRTQEEEPSAEIEVRLRTNGAHSAPAFEESVRWAAGEVLTHLAAGQKVGLVTDRERLRPDRGARQRALLLSFLALVKLRDSSEGIADRTRRTGARAR